MATLLFQAAGAALGSVFGPFGAILGRAAGALAGSVVDRSLINGMTKVSGARLGDARIPGADEGTAISRVYGTARIGGTLIWATRFAEEVSVERTGGKASGPRVETFRYFANCAVGICEGPIAGIRRVWADGRELDLTGIAMRLYRGTAEQAPDPLIEAKQGAGNTPAYRGLAYVVFEHLPLDTFGNRIPVLQFEVLKPIGSLEEKVRAVTIIPGSSEHGYDPRLVTEKLGAGRGRNINRNTLVATTDWEASIDELMALCPNLERVGLVVAWFGTDLRAGHCRIVPGVEVSARTDESRPWRVCGIGRAPAYVVSQSGGGPAYGGTPSDASVVAAIKDLKARGIEVYLYPFVLMDVPADNSLPDPYGGARQASYPWRGRITCHPQSADGTAAAGSQVAAFVGDAEAGDFSVSGEVVSGPAGDEGFRRLILHYALLAEAAGGVDGFLIGSEMRGLTWLRDEAGGFPFVSALCDLAVDVRTVLRPATKITYAADWSEYFGFQPADGSGEVRYHLDPLWASPAIDAVGIDNYMPLADWRDGDVLAGNPDGFQHGEDLDAMRGLIAAGEGFDWYYANDSARAARLRSPITDGAAGKPWVFRYKDIESWWTNFHHERGSGGSELTGHTAWVPRSKPVWFTELGCPAADKGPNQPNVFVDPKSAENALPYFSGGARGDAVQRRFLDAHHGWWQGSGPEAGMVDPGHVFLWTWDARPYPAFPENTALWSDGGNWQRGHWLNGRLGAGTLADVIAAILSDHGFSTFDVSGVAGDLPGFVQAEQSSARALLEPLMEAFQIDALEADGKLVFRSRQKSALPPLEIGVLAERPDEAAFEESRGHAGDFSGEAILDHFDAAAAYGRVTARSRRMADGSDRVLRLALPAVLHDGAAASAVEAALRDQRAGQRRVTFRLPPTMLGVTPGDVVRLADGPEGRFLVTGLTDGLVREVEARAIAAGDNPAFAPAQDGRSPTGGAGPADAFAPEVVFLDLPIHGPGEAEDFARVAAYAKPWRAMVVSSSDGSEGFRARTRLERPARMGWLAAPLVPGVLGRFDPGREIVLDLASGGLSSVDGVTMLNGANRLAVRAQNGGWEIIGFAGASEIAPGRWRLTTLLRGLHGTEDAMAAGHLSGTLAVVLDEAVRPVGLDTEEVGRLSNWLVEAVGATEGQAGPFVFAGGERALKPLAPGHLRGRRGADGVVRFSWMRRGRVDADTWLSADIPLDEPTEAYRFEILSGSTVVRRVETVNPAFTYAAAAELADFGMAQTAIRIRVRQMGRAVPLGVPAEAVATL
ncbi:glycoside hydrolase/phage tail family protein [Shinella sp. CPCC 101442]|uniref:baseplate multidomain protein megatron n=1 Tax=Shinella sp. CPCC 101442 TaxID=2932265 RepID=UPI0021529C7B|nr:glycoside hydrolase/phage tail family protein [Shinella sp. CPCC 101442]MCR6498898.1 glycoside hydrolase/phage tail family protein [Shinella sp. CPCC 101442]